VIRSSPRRASGEEWSAIRSPSRGSSKG
jgi:hypothetical protein